MPPSLGAVGLARTARRYLDTARDLEERWKRLTPEQQDQLREELKVMQRIAADVQGRLTFGLKGFMSEFKAARDGREPEPLDEGRPLSESVADLRRATRAMAAALDR